ncbi:uncharacterized protein si:ch73-382f3.1 isoform X3 [Phyllopteryx taeniolatus]|uniref:uncharacterized protein si:ch73-382f3.1 isoform X3 n=1 Tax=Phyllopteryx taeniolatus TaxID=161469 RepID=UPI002AD4CF80|nr:uncharacterized protein si:ch73-382f3.1 isoform X3 [Phyllopteryx taeniolatus]
MIASQLQGTYRQTIIHTHIHTYGQFRIFSQPTIHVLGIWKKPEYPKKTHAGTGRTSKLQTGRPDLNPGPKNLEKELNVGDHGYARRTPFFGLEEEDGDRTALDQQSCTQCHLLKKQLEKEMQHTMKLQKEAEEMKKRLYRLDRIEKGLQNFLYEDQIRALSLTKRSRRAVWSPETILKARKIRSAVGTKGYEYLRELGYPLPSYRTLCNRLETKIMVTTDMSCEELAELGLGLMATCDSPTENVGDNEEEDLLGVLS